MTGFGRSTLPPGTEITDRYVVVAHLGSGGMGDVYEVEHKLLHRRFALKRLPDEKTSNRRLVERFLREARAAAATGHPGIVQVFDLGFAGDGAPYLVMERLDGMNLREGLKRGGITEAEAVGIAADVLDALAAVHDRGIVHRDIKPENIFLCDATTTGARVKVLDFGLAMLQEGEEAARLTRTGALMGTPLFMSPEQARGQEVDPRTDLYSLGAVLYECVAGHPPFMARHYTGILARVLEEPPDPAPLAKASESVRATILQALEKDPEDRFDTAAAMRVALLGGTESVHGTAKADPPDPAARYAHTEGGDSRDRATGDVAASGEAAFADTHISADAGLADTYASEPDDASASAPGRHIGIPAAPPAQRVPGNIAAWTGVAALLAVVALVAIRPWERASVVGTAGASTASPLATTSGSALVDSAPPLADGTSGPIPGEPAEVRGLLERGDLEAAAEAMRRAALRAPDDLLLRSRGLVLAMLVDRVRAYDEMKRLPLDELPPVGKAVVAAAAGFEVGDPLRGVAALEAGIAASPEDLALRHLRADLLRHGDRFPESRVAYLEILERWPAYEPAVEGLLERLLILDEVDEARRVVNTYIAAAPDDARLDMLELELMVGEQRYGDVLARVQALLAADPARETEFAQFHGDARLLVWDIDRAIAAYDSVTSGPRRDTYVAGALLHAGRVTEARDLLVGSIEAFPDGSTKKRIGTMVVMACILAVETGDRELAERLTKKLGPSAENATEARLKGAIRFAEVTVAVLSGESLDRSHLLLAEASPYGAWLRARELKGAEALAVLRPVTEPEGVHFGVVSTHINFALWTERARAALEAGELEEALRFVDRVIRPRHFDSSRGVVIERALSLRVEILRALGREGEAGALEREIRTRFAG